MATKELKHDNPQPILGDKLDFATREAYNLFRTNVAFSFPDNKDCKVIGLTSACPQEGKSYNTINLAYAFAMDGKKVLLIDADMRKPSIARSLGLVKNPGLSNIIIDNNEDVIHKNVLCENLDVILSGKNPPNPTEMLGSLSTQKLLEEFKKSYDYIIFDLPPVGIVSDALVVSKYLDGMVLVIRHEYSKKKDVKEAVSRLKFSNVRILGVLYNGFTYSKGGGYLKRKSYRGYYYNNYNGYHSYYSSKDDEEDKNEEVK